MAAPTTGAAILADKLFWVERTSHLAMALHRTILKTGGVDAIPGPAAACIAVFKLSTYEYDAVRFPRIDQPTMVAAFHEIAKTGLPVAIHSDDQKLVESSSPNCTRPAASCRSGIAERNPPLAETMADLEIFAMALETGAHVHTRMRGALRQHSRVAN